MDRELPIRDDVAIVVADGLSARQWEAHLSAARIAHREAAWISPPVASYAGWRERLWSTGHPERPPPLTPLQASVLWRSVVASSAESAALIGTDGAGEWAAQAWHLLCNWRLDPRQLRAGPEQLDFRALLRWCGSYRERLEANGWTDAASLDAALPEVELVVPRELVLADLTQLTPARQALLHRLERDGCRIEHWPVPHVDAVVRRIGLADGTGELRAAAEWAKRRLGREPAARIALVVPDLAQNALEVEHLLTSRLGALPLWHRGGRLASQPLLGAALNALELLSAHATFATFSRWLRSPLFGALDPAELSSKARLEGRLRTELSAQLGFRQAYRVGGWAPLLRRDYPTIAQPLDAAFTELGTVETVTPGRWAELWQRALTRLRWPPASCRGDEPELLGWQAALTQLATLTPILGAVTPERALQELGRILRQSHSAAALPLAGVHVLAQVDEIGPGYDAAWVSGLTDTGWPQAAPINPLLPRRLQAQHGMPWSTPQDARDRAAHSLRRLLERVPEVVLSWPRRVYDYAAEPSPSIRSFAELTLDAVAAAHDDRHARRTRETLVDDPPPLTVATIPGGSGALNRQARCPLRAFCQDRLGARALEPIGYGLSARLRGIVAHRALELLLRARPSQRQIAQMAADGGAVAASVEQALNEAFRDARRPLEALFRLEQERLAEQLLALMRSDASRAPFRVDAVEERRTLQFRSRALRIRVDRVDRLEAGGIAIIDYKTGRRTSTADWFKERLRDTQVPIYAVHAAETPSAVVLARLGDDPPSYQGVWEHTDEFPGRSRKLPHERSWAEQLAVWRTQIEQLLDELVAGDTRLFTASEDLDEARGAYAPLTRVIEQLALRHGSLRTW